MRYIVAFFWSFILGQVVCYIGGALSSAAYDFKLSTIISLAAALIICLIGNFSQPAKKST
ncbi:YjzD family protein [Enterococcus hirae]|nr:YjzD family protein [Enterococcus hirae]